MKKNKFITIGICATVLANIVTSPAIALAEVVAENATNSVEEVVETTTEEAIIPEAPAAEEPIVEAPVAETPVAEEPVIEAPVVETPVVEEPIIEEPVAETPEVPKENTTEQNKPEVKPIKPEAKPAKDENQKEENKTLTQAEKDAFMSKSTLEFQGLTYTYSEFLKFSDTLQRENYVAATFDAMTAARLTFRQTLGAATDAAGLAKVKVAANAFVAAMNGLRVSAKPSSAKLEAAIKAVKWDTLVKEDYTEVSWNNLMANYYVAIDLFEISKTKNIYQEQLDSIAEKLNLANKALRKKVVATQVVNVNADLTGDVSYLNSPYTVSQTIGDGITIQIWDMAAQNANQYQYILYVDGVIAVKGIGTYAEDLLISADTINNGQDASNGRGNDLREVKTDVNLHVTNNRIANALDINHTFNFTRYAYGAEQTFVVGGAAVGTEGYSYVTATYTEFGIALEYSENGKDIAIETLLESKNSAYTFDYMENGTYGRMTINFAFVDNGIVDKTELEELLYLINATINPKLYTNDSVAVLLAAIQQAGQVLHNPLADDLAVSTAVTELKAAMNQLVLLNPVVYGDKLNTADLVAEIGIAKAKDASLYTTASWSKLTSALEVAETVLRYADFNNVVNNHTARAAEVNVNVTQAMVATATANLKTAVADLKLAAVTEPIEDPKLNPGTGSDAGTGKGSDTLTNVSNTTTTTTTKTQPATNKVVKGKKLSQTNVTLGAMPALGGVGAAIASIMTYVRSKKK